MVTGNQGQEPQIYPPPQISTPQEMPWTQMNTLIQSINQLVTLMQSQMGIGEAVVSGQLGAPGIAVLPASFGQPGTTQQLVNVMLESTPGALGHGDTLPFKKSVPSEYQDEQERLVNRTSIVDWVLMSFPAGCQHLVDVRLTYHPTDGGPRYIIPSIEESYIALDDTTVIFSPVYLVERPGKLRVEWWNYDTLNSHEVVVIASLKPTRLSY